MCLIIGHTVCAQDNQIISKEAHYYYEGKKYELLSLDSIFCDQPDASLFYLQGKKQYSASNRLGTISLISLGLGFVSLVAIKNEPDYSFAPYYTTGPNLVIKTYGAILAGIGVLCGVASLMKGEKGIKNINKAIDLFNTNKSFSGNSVSLNIGLTDEGLGLILNF